MSLSPPLHYNLSLPANVNDIIQEDFWILDHVSVDIIRLVTEPVKFTSTASIFVRRGRFKAEIDLVKYEFQAPCIVNIGSEHILQYPEVSDDFDASFLVLSSKVQENMFIMFNDTWLYSAFRCMPIVKVPEEDVPHLENLYRRLNYILKDVDSEFKYRAVFFTLVSFMFTYGLKYYLPFKEKNETFTGRLSERFLRLLRENFKHHRMLDFYASNLQVTSKHLSRTVKEQTGTSAVEWINRYVIVEAKVLLKSTDLHIQQIADELNFGSQSVFGKFFKKHAGVSPREFRNQSNID